MRLFYKRIQSPVGSLQLVAGERGLVAVLWQTEPPGRVSLTALDENNDYPLLRDAEKELQEYFEGTRRSFTLPLDMRGTPFQRQVWAALLSIPFGETRTYGQIASQLGDPAATRAVGAANGRNPVAIIAPCHRVIGASGKLTGFAGGLHIKAFLLQHESGAGSLFS